MAKKKPPRTIPAASPEDLQATIVNHNPSRKRYRRYPWIGRVRNTKA